MDQFISEVLNNGQINPVLIAPVLVVFVGAILVFVFGFKKPVEPQFKKLAAVDTSKKARRKEKSQKLTQNGSLIATQDKSHNEVKKKDVSQVEKLQQKNATISGKKEKSLTKKDVSPSKKLEDKKSLSSPPKKQVPSTKKEKSQPKEKIAENDGGEWMTVTKDKKKRVEELYVSPETLVKKSEKSSPKQARTGNEKNKKKDSQKQPAKEQSTKSKKDETKAKNVENIDNVKIEEKEVSEEKISSSLLATTSPEENPSELKLNEETDVSNTIKVVEEKSSPKKDLNDDQDVKVDVRFTEGNNVVFDELGDAWTEAKAPRKSKKKARKE